jgi:hypothetical protein
MCLGQYVSLTVLTMVLRTLTVLTVFCGLAATAGAGVATGATCSAEGAFSGGEGVAGGRAYRPICEGI